MEFLGDLERLFATSLYPLRVPIAIGLAIALVVLVVVARRRGWFAAARRHPFRTGALVAVLLVAGLPTAWYVGSPLFIRTAIVEPAPSAGPGEAPVATSASGTDAPSPEPEPSSAGGGMELRGEFVGADEFHFGSGTARLIETAPGEYTVRFETFSVRNGPDLYVYLSPRPDGYTPDAIELGTLRATDGDFNIPVPPGTDISNVRSVLIWCKQFAVLFAHAELS